MLTKSGILFDCFFTIWANNDVQQLSFYFKTSFPKKFFNRKVFVQSTAKHLFFCFFLISKKEVSILAVAAAF